MCFNVDDAPSDGLPFIFKNVVKKGKNKYACHAVSSVFLILMSPLELIVVIRFNCTTLELVS